MYLISDITELFAIIFDDTLLILVAIPVVNAHKKQFSRCNYCHIRFLQFYLFCCFILHNISLLNLNILVWLFLWLIGQLAKIKATNKCVNFDISFHFPFIFISLTNEIAAGFQVRTKLSDLKEVDEIVFVFIE